MYNCKRGKSNYVPEPYGEDVHLAAKRASILDKVTGRS
jgi:hypothetical protein